ncbi:MAG: helix-turn-helix transcriptional regulator [Alphaproteobacteria bacterium]|nr:helix-turn-helix transcriptional regulator [Alphaproteobacteria bacterium]MCY3755753.1 helix-turn-helix transcriptional regulator [Alphaproteobacteria bacterium]
MDRRDVSRLFRLRLAETLARSGLSRSALARRAGIDRSTLSQLLAGDMDRLPRADTVAAIATELRVSLDWLLGLSHVERLGADILHESLQIAESAQTPVDETLVRWFEEAAGYKVRNVPTTIPDVAKTEEVLRHEYRHFSSRGPDRAINASRDRLEHFRLPEADMEICLSRQALETLAAGGGIWRTLDASARRHQLDRLAGIVGELYPRLRMYLFDGLTHYSAPYTIFGRQRAALYVGQVYMVFNTTEHIAVLNRHFDDLIRAAVVQPTELVSFLAQLRDGARGAG